MATEMTKNQEKAILSSGKNVLVSASAGSGKTFVMIERIIRLILEENVDVSNILAVTFTKLAASEMKQKLVKAVISRISDGKDVERMRKTLAELPTADISTIHSFCLNLLKTYFYSANVDPDFSIIESAKARELSTLAINETFNELYEQGDENFLATVRFLRKNRGDNQFKKEILELYDKSVSESDPDAFLNSCKNSVSEKNYTLYEDFILNVFKKQISAHEDTYNQLKLDVAPYSHEKVGGIILAALEDAWAKAKYCLNAKTLSDFALALTIQTSSLSGTKTNDEVVAQIKKEVSDFKSGLADLYKKIIKSIPKDRDLDLKRYLETKQMTCTIVDIAKLYGKKFSALKEKEGALDFSDLEHKALALLKNNPDVLAAVREKYQYIFADEYQDVNGAQEELLSLISNNNLFMVGDVKQSIYAFRGCNPDIFASKYDSYLKDESLGEAIPLDKNFRSSDKVLDAVNNVFSSVITKEHGGVAYAENKMESGGLFEKGYGEATLHVITKEKADKQPIEGLYNLVKDATSIYNFL